MYSRKIGDEIKVKRIWWLKPEQRPRMRKNRKQCSCWMCGNPRKYLRERTLKEQSLDYLHQDEINEFFTSQ